MNDVRPTRGGCLDPEDLAAYLDGRLGPERRAAIDTHLVACERCYDLFAESAATLAAMHAPEVSRGGPTSIRHPRWLYGAIGVAAAVVLVVGGRPYLDPALRLNRHVATVVTAAAARPFEVRLTGEELWRPVAAPVRGENLDDRLPGNARVALVRIEEALAAGRTGSRLAAYGRASLAVGRVDRAIAALEEAVALGDATPAVLSDLAAGYIARAQTPGRAGDLPRALDAVNQALSKGEIRPESLFNKAIALERLNLRAEAIDAWKQYLAADPDSAWAAEAREHLARLEEDDTRTDAGASLEHLLACFLPEWATGVLNGRDPAPGLADARAIVRTLPDPGRDAFATDVVEKLASLAGDRQPFQRALHAVVAYGAGRSHYALDKHELAEISLAQAERELLRLGHPLSASATVYRGLSAYRRKDLDGAHRLLGALAADAGERKYRSITGRVHWVRGLMWLNEGRLRDGAASYQAAIADLTAAGHHADAAFVIGLLATSYERLGDPVRMWQARLQALQGSAREGTLLRAAAEARREGWHWAARDFAAAGVRVARRGGRTANIADALRLQAVIESQLGEAARAESMLAEARSLLSGLTDSTKDRVCAEVDLATAMVAAATGNTRSGIDAATRAFKYFSTTSRPTEDRLPEILLTRARLARQAGSLDSARADLEHGLTIYGRMRQFADAGVDQATLADVARRLTDELVALIAPADEPGAFREVERVRAWDLARENDGDVLTLASAREQLPDGAVLASYVVGDSSTHLWTIRRGESRRTLIPAGRRHLIDLVSALRSSSAEGARRELSRLLIEPLDAHLRPGDLLAIVPDGPLHQLPFSALRTRTNRYLVEEHAVLIGPSVSALLRQRDRDVAAPVMLAIGNPAFTAVEWPGLADLPGAAREAQSLVQDRPGAIHLGGAGATRAAVLQHLPHASIVHFAGHAVVNEFRAAESALVLAGRDRLTAGDVRHLRLDHVGLVVLASCESAGGFRPRSDGPMGLARAFQAAGVRYVLAALRPIDDRRARTFFAGFHASLARGSDPANALRSAQLEAIAADPSPDAAVHWSSYVLTGPLSASSLRADQP